MNVGIPLIPVNSSVKIHNTDCKFFKDQIFEAIKLKVIHINAFVNLYKCHIPSHTEM